MTEWIIRREKEICIHPELIVKNFAGRHAVGAVEELFDVEVHLDEPVAVGALPDMRDCAPKKTKGKST